MTQIEKRCEDFKFGNFKFVNCKAHAYALVWTKFPILKFPNSTFLTSSIRVHPCKSVAKKLFVFVPRQSWGTTMLSPKKNNLHSIRANPRLVLSRKSKSPKRWSW